MKIVNIGVLAHVDAGKTTLTESMLLKSGVIASAGRVDKGTTITDSMELERKRGITIRSSSVSFFWKDTKINLLDTPGHADFIAEVERVLSVLDGAVLVISAKEGVQVQTRMLFQALSRLKIPTILFVNKLDRVGVRLEEAYARIRELLSPNIAIMQRVSGLENGDIVLTETSCNREEIEDILLNIDEALGERYLSGEVLSAVDYDSAFRRCVRGGGIFPLYHGAALRGIGTEALLDGISAFLPRPEMPAEHSLKARVYQIYRDEKLGRLACLRLVGGRISQRDLLELPGCATPIRVRHLYGLEQGKIVPASSVPAGDIALLGNTPELKAGMALGIEELDNTAPLGQPTMEAAVSAACPGERRRLMEALDELSDEDPYLASSVNPVTGELAVRVFGEVQLEILAALILERYGITARFGPLCTIYRERPIREAEGVIPIYTWPNPYYAGIALRVSPLPPGSGFQYETRVSFGYLTTPFQTAVREGVAKGCRHGRYGWEVTDIKVMLFDAKYDSVMSSPADFRRLSPFVLEQALRRAGTQLLEPMLRFHLRVPMDCGGKAASDLKGMRADIEGMAEDREALVFTGRIPAQTCTRYSVHLSAYTRGLGVFLTQPDGYAGYQGRPVSQAVFYTEEENRIRYLLQTAEY